MKNKLIKTAFKVFNPVKEFNTEERCFINETSNDADDPDVSISRARVEPNTTTAWHLLNNTAERYLIISGKGNVELDYNKAIEVNPGDIVRIPQGIPQRISNIGKDELIFYCICTPKFDSKNYISLE